MKERITPVALSGAVACGLLAPMFRLSGGVTGPGGWLSPLAALGILLLPMWVLIQVCRVLPGGGGLETLYDLAYGRGLGRLLTGLTGLWAALCGAAGLGYYGESMVSALYRDTEVWVFLAGVMAVAWRASDRGWNVLCRTAGRYLIIIGCVLALVTLLSLRDLRRDYLWPVEDWQGLVRSAVTVAGVQAPLLLILLRNSGAAGSMGGGKALTLALAGSEVTVLGMRAVVIGMFGWQRAAKLPNPLFNAAREVYLMDIFERIEALVVAIWVLADIVWIAAMLEIAAKYCASAAGRTPGRVLTAALTIMMVVLAGRRIPTEQWLQWGSLTICMALPLLGSVTARVRGKI